MIPTIKYQWFDVAGVHLIDNHMTIGNSGLLAIQSAQQSATPLIHIDAAYVSIAFTSITTLRVIWQDGTPIEKGSLIYNGAFLIIDGC